MSGIPPAILIFLAVAVRLSVACEGQQNQQSECDGRNELREVDASTLLVLQHQFEQLQQECAHNETLISELEPEGTPKIIIERLEEKIGVKLPYWDHRMDGRLVKPVDSSILLLEFCRREGDEVHSNNSLVENFYSNDSEFDQQVNEIEQSCKNGALLALLRRIFALANASQEGCSRCETENSKKWLFCDSKKRECVSKIMPDGNCTTFEHNPECCYESKCQEGRCSLEKLVIIGQESAPDESRPGLSENVTVSQGFVNPDKPLQAFISQPESVTLSTDNDLISEIDSVKANTLKIRALVKEKDLQLTKTLNWKVAADEGRVPKNLSAMQSPKFENLDNYWSNVSSVEDKYDSAKTHYNENVEQDFSKNRRGFKKKRTEKSKKKEKFEIDEVVGLKHPKSSFPVQRHNSTFRGRKFSKYSYYRKSRRLKQLKQFSKLPKNNAHLYGHDIPAPPSKGPALFSSVTGPTLRKKLKFGTKRVKLSRKKQRKATDAKFYQFLLPTAAAVISPPQYVFFSITVIEGRPKRNNLLHRAPNGCKITLIGANMPYGFTETIMGQLSQDTTSGIVRTLNPELFGPLVEFNITVTDQHGHPCEQRCLSSKGFYERCEDRPIRLSSHEFIAFSDPVEVYETQKSLVESQWTGRGYFRKRKRDFLLFACDG